MIFLSTDNVELDPSFYHVYHRISQIWLMLCMPKAFCNTKWYSVMDYKELSIIMNNDCEQGTPCQLSILMPCHFHLVHVTHLKVNTRGLFQYKDHLSRYSIYIMERRWSYIYIWLQWHGDDNILWSVYNIRWNYILLKKKWLAVYKHCFWMAFHFINIIWNLFIEFKLFLLVTWKTLAIVAGATMANILHITQALVYTPLHKPVKIYLCLWYHNSFSKSQWVKIKLIIESSSMQIILFCARSIEVIYVSMPFSLIQWTSEAPHSISSHPASEVAMLAGNVTWWRNPIKVIVTTPSVQRSYAQATFLFRAEWWDALWSALNSLSLGHEYIWGYPAKRAPPAMLTHGR